MGCSTDASTNASCCLEKHRDECGVAARLETGGNEMVII